MSIVDIWRKWKFAIIRTAGTNNTPHPGNKSQRRTNHRTDHGKTKNHTQAKEHQLENGLYPFTDKKRPYARVYEDID